MYHQISTGIKTGALILAVGAVAACSTTEDMVARLTGSSSASDVVDTAKLEAVLADPRRDNDRGRDASRHPAETIAFFGIGPTDTVVEALPGGGWYRRVLLPYLTSDGQYMAVNYPVELWGDRLSEERREAVANWPQTYPVDALEDAPEGAKVAAAFVFGSVPEEIKGTVDHVVYIRALHHLSYTGWLDDAIKDTFDMLKPGGVVGIVQHRAKADAPEDYSTGTKGYLKEADVIAAFEAGGFKLEGSSGINANPKDTADYEGGVWTLPPSLRGEDEDKDKYVEIGESDRMTLKFVKP